MNYMSSGTDDEEGSGAGSRERERETAGSVNPVFFVFFFLIMHRVIFNPNNFPSLLQQHLFSDDVFTGRTTCQSQATTIQSIPHGQKKSRPTFFLV